MRVVHNFGLTAENTRTSRRVCQSATSFDIASSLGISLALADGQSARQPFQTAFVTGSLALGDNLGTYERESLLFGSLLSPLARPLSLSVHQMAPLQRRARAGQVCLESLSFGPIAAKGLTDAFERWDGGGPGGLTREQASPVGRMLACGLLLTGLLPPTRPSAREEQHLREELLLEGGHSLDPWMAETLGSLLSRDDFWALLYANELPAKLPHLFDLVFAEQPEDSLVADCLAIGRYAVASVGGNLAAWEVSVSLAQIASRKLELHPAERVAAVAATALADWGVLVSAGQADLLTLRFIRNIPGFWRIASALESHFAGERGNVCAQVVAASRAAAVGAHLRKQQDESVVGRCVADLCLEYFANKKLQAA